MHFPLPSPLSLVNLLSILLLCPTAIGYQVSNIYLLSTVYFLLSTYRLLTIPVLRTSVLHKSTDPWKANRERPETSLTVVSSPALVDPQGGPYRYKKLIQSFVFSLLFFSLSLACFRPYPRVLPDREV